MVSVSFFFIYVFPLAVPVGLHLLKRYWLLLYHFLPKEDDFHLPDVCERCTIAYAFIFPLFTFGLLIMLRTFLPLEVDTHTPSEQ